MKTAPARTIGLDLFSRIAKPVDLGQYGLSFFTGGLLALLLLIKIGCDDELPGFTPRTRDGYAAWRAQNLEQVQRIERSEGYRLSLVQYRLERALRPVSPAPASAPAPDPKATVRHYADALCYGNVAAALGVQVRP